MLILLTSVLVGLIGLLYYKNTKHYGMFSAHGVFEPPKTFPLGTHFNWDMIARRKHMSAAMNELQKKYGGKHKALGCFMNERPTLIITDVELTKKVLVKDFDHFSARRPILVPENTETGKIVNSSLGNSEGEKWKKGRSVLTTVYTSGKLKAMNPAINKVGARVVGHVNDLADSGEEFPARDFMAKYMLESIAASAFGIEAKSFEEPDGVFAKMLDGIIREETESWSLTIKFVLTQLFQSLTKLINVSMFSTTGIEFLAGVLKQNMRQRKESNDKRGDLMDIVAEALQNTDDEKPGDVADDDRDEYDRDADVTTDYKLTEEEVDHLLIAAGISHFFVGFHTTSLALTMVMGFLAKHQDVQEKLYEEIREAFETHGSQDLDYYAVKGMSYLEAVFLETIRFYLAASIGRTCTKDYLLPDTTFVVPKGMLIEIPASVCHRNPEFFPDPERFNPDVNWSPEARAARPSFADLTFSQGPRNCIAKRFASLVCKMALIRVVGNFKILEGKQMPKEFVMDPESRSRWPLGGVWCKVVRRN